MKEPLWLNQDEISAVHAGLLSRFGGAGGVRDMGLLEAALQRPLNRFHYEDPSPSLCELAAAYAEAIVGKHPFVDGNKRTGFVAAALFLQSNGYRLVASEESAVERTLALAACVIGESEYAAWLTDNCDRLTAT
ncbi:MAG: type II toxin-antitoxin system death-on-curing family toxin [Opitutales bacterium]|nr:type II toxin-antitoxin system death-on-curing family toxin [Opitutales bacterium]